MNEDEARRYSAVRKVLGALLAGPLYMASRESKEEALKLAREHSITAEELLLALYDRAKRH